MTSSHGVIQGYNGIAALDDKYQIIVPAKAHGRGSEHQTLESVIDGLANNFERIGEGDVVKQAVITADN